VLLFHLEIHFELLARTCESTVLQYHQAQTHILNQHRDMPLPYILVEFYCFNMASPTADLLTTVPNFAWLILIKQETYIPHGLIHRNLSCLENLHGLLQQTCAHPKALH
jgi:hypothetical protein